MVWTEKNSTFMSKYNAFIVRLTAMSGPDRKFSNSGMISKFKREGCGGKQF
jgi:hypothetical protein